MTDIAEDQPEWLQQYLAGKTLDEVAPLAGVSKMQVSNRLRNLGIKVRSAAETHALRRQHQLETQGERVRSEFLRMRNVEAVGVEVGLPTAVVRDLLSELVPDFQVLARAPRNSQKMYTEKELLASLTLAADQKSGVLSVEAYREFVADYPDLKDGRARPGPQVMGLRFGGWNAALTAAGLPTNPHAGPPKEFDDPAAALESIIECWRALEAPPTVAAYDLWQRGKEGHPSAATTRKILGESWNVALVRAWQVVHGIQLNQDDEDAALPPTIAVLLDDPDGYAPYSPADEEAVLNAAVEQTKSHLEQLQQAVQSHRRIQNAVAAELVLAGVAPLSPGVTGPRFDVAFRAPDGAFVVVEVKSCTDANRESQLRMGLGQVLRYAHELHAQHQVVRPVLAIELEPPLGWTDLLNSLGVVLVREKHLPTDLQQALGGSGPEI